VIVKLLEPKRLLLILLITFLDMHLIHKEVGRIAIGWTHELFFVEWRIWNGGEVIG
jgi:hypothetical protein